MLAATQKYDILDFLDKLHALARDFQRLSGPHQLRCELHAGSDCLGEAWGGVAAPFARMLEICLYISILRIVCMPL